MVLKNKSNIIIFGTVILVLFSICLLVLNSNVMMNNNEKKEADKEMVENEISDESDIEFSIKVNDNGYIINPYLVDNIYYFFLPQGMDLKKIVLNYTGNITDVSTGTIYETNREIINDFSLNNTLIINVGDIDYTVIVLKSDLPSMSIFLNDVELEEVHSGTKNIKYTDNLLFLENNGYNFIDTNVELKGRGNFTWTLPKKAYQLKLSSDKNMLGLGKSKTWILLANYADASLIRNKIIFDLATDIGLEYTSESRYIDLWINGDYQGNYLLMEKIEVGKNRVQLTEDDALIVEIDNNYYESEDNYFISKFSNTAFVLKDSVADDEKEELSKTKHAFLEFEDYINEFESYLYSDDKDFEKISSMIDVESFIKFYFIQEFTEDPDGARSSVYLYKNGEKDKLHIGPVWDYDSSLGNYTSTNLGGNTKVDYIINIKNYMENSNDWYTELFKIEEFKELSLKIYNENIKKSLQNISYKIDNYKNLLNRSSKMNFIRWKVLGKNTPFNRSDRVNEKTYSEEVDYLLNWILDRIDYMNKRYEEN